jgi:predicted GIY-YIG superfamily endonuclease
MSTNVYVLRCEGGKRYVGKAADVQKRFQEHKNGNGSAWTNKYKPLIIEKIYKNVSPYEEDKITKETMGKYGINNVRGGTYCSTKLSDTEKESLEKEIRGAQDCCFKCGDKSHFARYCKNDKEGNDDDDDEEEDEEDDDDDDDDDEEEDEDEEDDDDDDDDDDDYYSD